LTRLFFCILIFGVSGAGAVADDGPPMATTLDVNVLPISFVSNEFAYGWSTVPEPLLNIEATFRVYRHPVIFDQSLTELAYPHPAGYVSNIAQPGSHFVGAQNILEYHNQQWLGVGLGPGYYLEASQWFRGSSSFYNLIGLGIALERTPDYRRRFTLFGRLAYYPKVVDESRGGVIIDHHRYPVNYQLETFSGGALTRIGRSNGFLRYGVTADVLQQMVNAPGDSTNISVFVGYLLRVI
jgi:hypothetical protein